MAQVRLIIVDDHPVVRTGLHGMLAGQPDFDVLGEAADGAEAVALALRTRPDVVLMDLRMPGVDGVSAIRQLQAQLPEAHVLVLTTYDTDADILPAIEAGATGYLLKDTPREDLARAIRSAARGEAVLAPTVAARLMRQVRAPAAAPVETLSTRELDVLRCVAQGESNKEIARRLHVSEATVKSHLLHIFAKLGVADRTAAVTVALGRGQLQLADTRGRQAS